MPWISKLFGHEIFSSQLTFHESSVHKSYQSLAILGEGKKGLEPSLLGYFLFHHPPFHGSQCREVPL